MKNNLIHDIGAAVDLFKDIRKERKNGSEVNVQKFVQIPLIYVGIGFYDTIEGCVLANCSADISYEARMAYDILPYETKRLLVTTPGDGEFMARVNCWKRLLTPVMTPKQCQIAITAILHWYIHIKRMRLGLEAEADA